MTVAPGYHFRPNEGLPLDTYQRGICRRPTGTGVLRESSQDRALSNICTGVRPHPPSFGTLSQNMHGAQNRRKPILPYSISMSSLVPGVTFVSSMYKPYAVATRFRVTVVY